MRLTARTALPASLLVILSWAAPAQAEDAAPPPAACPGAPVAQRVGLQDLWAQFRRLAVAQDINGLKPLVRFPLTISSGKDNDDQTKLGRNTFNGFFPTFLASDTGELAKPRTVSEFIADLTCVADTVLNPAGDSAVIGPMVFAKDGAQWQLVEVFMDLD